VRYGPISTIVPGPVPVGTLPPTSWPPTWR